MFIVFFPGIFVYFSFTEINKVPDLGELLYCQEEDRKQRSD